MSDFFRAVFYLDKKLHLFCSLGLYRAGLKALLLVAVVFSVHIKPIFAEETHKLQSQETIYQISKLYDIPLEVLLESNDIQDPTKLRTGRNIIIPSKNKQNSTATVSYRVKKGDTLYAIAKQYGTSVDNLVATNKLGSANSILIDSLLFVPSDKAQIQQLSQKYQENNKPTYRVENVDKPILGKDPSLSASATSLSKTFTPLSKTPTKQTPVKKIEISAQGKTSINKNTSVNNAAFKDIFLLEKTTSLGLVSSKWPVSGNLYSLDGNLSGTFIESTENSKVKSISSGVVLYAAANSSFRNVVVVQGYSGEIFIYGGQKKLFVKQGDTLKKGMVIGELGVMPFVKKSILYFAIIKKNKYINPKLYIG